MSRSVYQSEVASTVRVEAHVVFHAISSSETSMGGSFLLTAVDGIFVKIAFADDADVALIRRSFSAAANVRCAERDAHRHPHIALGARFLDWAGPASAFADNIPNCVIEALDKVVDPLILDHVLKCTVQPLIIILFARSRRPKPGRRTFWDGHVKTSPKRSAFSCSGEPRRFAPIGLRAARQRKRIVAL